MRMTEGPIHGVLGTMNIIGQNYLCVVKEVQVVGKLYGSEIFKITDVRLIPFYVRISLMANIESIDEHHT
jgi:SacI homology domain